MAVNLGGAGQYLDRNSTFGAFFPLTISFWFKTTLTTTAQTIVAESSSFSANNSRHTMYIDNDGKLKAATVDSAGNFGTPAASVASVTTNWHHGVAYFASNSTRTIYLDGVSASATTSPSPTVGSRNHTSIGARFAGTSTAGSFFYGRIAEVCIWSVQLTDGEIISLSQGAPALSIRQGSIVCYYPLGGFFGESGGDYSGNGRDMSQVGSPTWADHPALWFPQTSRFTNISPPSQMWIKVGGVWKTATPWINVGGVWKQSSPFIKNSGTWR